MLSREQVINMLKGKGVQVDESHTDAQLTEQLTNALAAKPEQKGEPVVNADLLAAMTATMEKLVKPLADQVTQLQANSQAAALAAKQALIGQIMAANSTYTKEDLEQAPEALLNSIAAQCVPAHGLSRGENQFTSNADASCSSLTLPSVEV